MMYLVLVVAGVVAISTALLNFKIARQKKEISKLKEANHNLALRGFIDNTANTYKQDIIEAQAEQDKEKAELEKGIPVETQELSDEEKTSANNITSNFLK